MLGPPAMKGLRRVDAIDKQLPHSCACGGQPLPGPAPHTSREDFGHFLAYSGWAGQDDETKAML